MDSIGFGRNYKRQLQAQCPICNECVQKFSKQFNQLKFKICILKFREATNLVFELFERFKFATCKEFEQKLRNKKNKWLMIPFSKG